tara:strand:+ start:814 stop:996 length:183 start_codon:yes stop_codon:yes gene_type:complete
MSEEITFVSSNGLIFTISGGYFKYSAEEVKDAVRELLAMTINDSFAEEISCKTSDLEIED